jgi:hypothetical protein
MVKREDVPLTDKSFSIKGEFSKSMGAIQHNSGSNVPKNDTKSKIYWYYRRKELKAMKNHLKSLSAGSITTLREQQKNIQGMNVVRTAVSAKNSPIIIAKKPQPQNQKDPQKLLQQIEQQQKEIQQQHRDQLEKQQKIVQSSEVPHPFNTATPPEQPPPSDNVNTLPVQTQNQTIEMDTPPLHETPLEDTQQTQMESPEPEPEPEPLQDNTIPSQPDIPEIEKIIPEETPNTMDTTYEHIPDPMEISPLGSDVSPSSPSTMTDQFDREDKQQNSDNTESSKNPIGLPTEIHTPEIDVSRFSTSSPQTSKKKSEPENHLSKIKPSEISKRSKKSNPKSRPLGTNKQQQENTALPSTTPPTSENAQLLEANIKYIMSFVFIFVLFIGFYVYVY